MGVPTFACVLFAGAALLALWLDVRLGDKGPNSLTQILLHIVGAMILLRAARQLIGVPDAPISTMIVILGAMLPSLVYVFLTSLWILKMVRGAMPR